MIIEILGIAAAYWSVVGLIVYGYIQLGERKYREYEDFSKIIIIDD